MRIASLLPSATEIICGLGLRDSLVAVSHECDYPHDVIDLPKVTQTLIPAQATSNQIDSLVRERIKTKLALYELDSAAFRSAAPDLIITQTLCDVCAVAESEVHAAIKSLPGTPRILNLEPTNLADVLNCIRQVGNAASIGPATERYVTTLRSRIDTVLHRSQSLLKRPSVLLLEWLDPPFCAGHWSPELVELAGGIEAIGIAGKRSVTTSWREIAAADPEVLVIACCGFNVERTMQDLPILQSQPGWSTLKCVQTRRVYLVDGSAYFNRPGPRLVDSLELLAHALHPTLHPLPDGVPGAKNIFVDGN
ncbi:MAG: cobalamin-binding protein [Planctomycetaceae bacterium]|nr:cobalamin-binding protein [Planctomycetaceae bacterium]